MGGDEVFLTLELPQSASAVSCETTDLNVLPAKKTSDQVFLVKQKQNPT